MDCLDDNIISAYIEGQVAPDDVAAIKAHLLECPTCTQLLDALNTTRAAQSEAGDQGFAPNNSDKSDPQKVLGGTYQLIREIGAGGMGSVYAAKHLRLDRQVAIKFLNAQLKNVPEALERFRSEALLAGKLENRHIIDVIDFNEDENKTPYIVMELLEGEDLAQRLAIDGALPLDQVVLLVKQICSALTAAHDEGILHRDLKPSNIFLCNDYDAPFFVKLLDFGIAKVRNSLVELTGSHEIVGTPAFIAPEMASRDQDKLGPASDIFSLGVIIYEALTGHRAFTGDSIPSVMYNIVHHTPKAPHLIHEKIPKALSLYVMRLLEKNASKRPQDALEVGQRFAALAKEQSNRNLFPPTTPQGLTIKSDSKKQPSFIVLLILLTTLIAGVSAFFWMKIPNEKNQTKTLIDSTTEKNVPTAKDIIVHNQAMDQGLLKADIPKPDTTKKSPESQKINARQTKKKTIQPSKKSTKKRDRRKRIDTDPLL